MNYRSDYYDIRRLQANAARELKVAICVLVATLIVWAHVVVRDCDGLKANAALVAAEPHECNCKPAVTLPVPGGGSIALPSTPGVSATLGDGMVYSCDGVTKQSVQFSGPHDVCPYCGSHSIFGGTNAISLDNAGSVAYGSYTCCVCSRGWDFRLSTKTGECIYQCAYLGPNDMLSPEVPE